MIVYPLGEVGGACDFPGAAIAAVHTALLIVRRELTRPDAVRTHYGALIERLGAEQRAYDAQCEAEAALIVEPARVTEKLRATLETHRECLAWLGAV